MSPFSPRRPRADLFNWIIGQALAISSMAFIALIAVQYLNA